METIRLVNTIVTVLFSLCAAYQLFYMVVPFLTRRKPQGQYRSCQDSLSAGRHPDMPENKCI